MKCLELAKTAIIKNESMPQTIATNTISISAEGYKRLEKKIHKFRSEVRAIVHKDEKKAEKVKSESLNDINLDDKEKGEGRS